MDKRSSHMKHHSPAAGTLQLHRSSVPAVNGFVDASGECFVRIPCHTIIQLSHLTHRPTLNPQMQQGPSSPKPSPSLNLASQNACEAASGGGRGSSGRRGPGCWGGSGCAGPQALLSPCLSCSALRARRVQAQVLPRRNFRL